jgi:predicted signal transduction protein with EAL and GGDEF domain
MSLSSRVVTLLLLVLASALVGSLVLHSWSARRALEQQLQLRNRDGAAALAVALSQHQGDLGAMQMVAQAHFDMGGYTQLAMQAPDGAALISLKRDATAPQAPPWFVRALPVRAQPGVAQVSSGWKQLGSLQLTAPSAWAHEALWQACSRTAALLLALGLVSAAAAVAALRVWRRPLRDTVAQAQALEAGRFVQAQEPRLPELRELTRSMNAMVKRMHLVLTQRAAEVETLQVAAQQDGLTRLLTREHFLARLGDLRWAPDAAEPTARGPALVLVLLRLHDLDRLNAAQGRAQTDALLLALADALWAYLRRVDGSFAGRLNGSDFALCLPVAGLAEDTARSLHGGLAQTPILKGAAAVVSVGGVEMQVGMPLGSALALADVALAQAEDGAGWFVQPVAQAPGAHMAPLTEGAQAWRQHIQQALSQHRTELAAYVVLGPQGQVLTLQCPLRVQMTPAGPYQVAAQWLALARRSRLMPQMDLRGLDLALAAIALDQQARTIHWSWPSLSAPGFVADVTRRLQQAPTVVGRLSIVWTHAASPDDLLHAAQPLQAFRAQGLRMGLEHGLGPVQRLVDFKALGLDFIKVDPSHLRGLGADPGVRSYVKGLVQLIHNLDAQAWAAGVDQASDLPELWSCGFDAATGVAVSAVHAQRQTTG